MSDVKWEQISFQNLMWLPGEDRKQCRVRIGNVPRLVAEVTASNEVGTRGAGGRRFWSKNDLEHWDAVIERPVPKHPHGRIPDEEGTVIRVHAGGQRIYERDEVWWETGDSTPIPTAAVQAFADKFGFSVLWPREGAGE